MNMLHKRCIILVLTITVSPIFCAKKSTPYKFASECDYHFAALSDRKLNNPRELLTSINTLINQKRYSTDEIADSLIKKLNGKKLTTIVSKHGKTVLYCAAQAGSLKSIDVIFKVSQEEPWDLLCYQDTVNKFTALHIATILDHEKTAKKLLAYAGARALEYIMIEDYYGASALEYCRKNNQQIFDLFQQYTQPKKE
jgi:hypothetical protein